MFVTQKTLILIVLTAILFGCNSSITAKAALQITSDPQSKIIINGTEYGTTPFFTDQLTANQNYQIKIQSNSGGFTSTLKLLPQTLTIINRQLRNIEQKSQGETISLEKGNGLKVLSTPSGAHVFIDGDFKGNSPINIGSLSLGDHRISVKKEGFVERSVRVQIRNDYTVIVDMQLATEDPPAQTILPKVRIKDSPTNFLRVRTDPDINSPEITRVTPGQEFEVLDIVNNFVQIKIDELTTGWVSSEYVQNL